MDEVQILLYEVRHYENTWADAHTIERNVLVNFWGYIALKDKKGIDLLNKKIDVDGALRVTTRSLDRFIDETTNHYDSVIPDECA